MKVVMATGTSLKVENPTLADTSKAYSGHNQQRLLAAAARWDERHRLLQAKAERAFHTIGADPNSPRRHHMVYGRQPPLSFPYSVSDVSWNRLRGPRRVDKPTDTRAGPCGTSGAAMATA